MKEYSIQIQIKSKNCKKVETIEISSGLIQDPKTILDLGLRHEEQIQLLQRTQNAILESQSCQLAEKLDECPMCKGAMGTRGYNESDFHSVFTDHKVKVRRQVCKGCNWKSIPSIKSLFGTSSHPDLLKLQCEMGAKHTYREAQDILNKKSNITRKINNHDQVHKVVEKIGESIESTCRDSSTSHAFQAKELIIHVDGGHLKDKDPKKRSFEAMTAVIYNPKNIAHVNATRREILNKNCAASALDDNQSYMKLTTLAAARKQGLSGSTNVVALSDGAENCWQISRSLKEHCKSFIGILDWFHISMKFQNIALPKTQQAKLKRVKWCLWHGNTSKALEKIDALLLKVKRAKGLALLNMLKTYITNNQEYIVNYQLRQQNNLVFTSHMAEATVESLINRRCKGKKHMRWSRIGAHYLLQVRSYIASNEWITDAIQTIMGAFSKPINATI